MAGGPFSAYAPAVFLSASHRTCASSFAAVSGSILPRASQANPRIVALQGCGSLPPYSISFKTSGTADLADGHRPNNTLGGIPTLALDYSPAWDANLYAWTPAAITSGYRGQLREEFNILTFVSDGLLTGPGGAPFGSAGFSINCPIVIRLN